MTEVEVTGTSKVIIGDLIEYSVDDFLFIMGGNTSLWCKGLLLAFNPVNSELFDKNFVENQVKIYRSVDFARLPEYTKMIKATGNLEVPILNYDKGEIAVAIVKYITEVWDKK